MLLIYMKIYQVFFGLFVLSESFIMKTHNMNNMNNMNNIKMNYDNYKGYDNIINFLPTFQASIIINNWIHILQLREEENPDIENTMPAYIKKNIYDMKFFISLNKEKKNTMILAWCPENNYKQKSVVYIVGGKVINNTLHIHRIAQSPYYKNIISLRSLDFKNELEKLIKMEKVLNGINYDELHNYDIRFKLSWKLGYYEN